MPSVAALPGLRVDCAMPAPIVLNSNQLDTAIRHPSEQLLHGDRQISNTLTSGVIHGVGDGRCHGHGSQFTQTLGTQRARFFIEAAYEQDIKLRNIRIGWDEVAGVVAVYELARRRIGLRLLQQGLSHTPDDAADRLAARRFRIDDPAGVIGADKAVQAHEPEVRVDAYLSKNRGEAED